MPTQEQLLEIWDAARLLVASYTGLTAQEINDNAAAKYPERNRIACVRDFDAATERIWVVINAT